LCAKNRLYVRQTRPDPTDLQVHVFAILPLILLLLLMMMMKMKKTETVLNHSIPNARVHIPLFINLFDLGKTLKTFCT
jgi:uncharacterized membrane protein YadS